MEHELGLGFTIAGFFIGVAAIILTIAIYRKVDTIRVKQIENAQGPYKSNTEKNLNEIHDHFRDLVRITQEYDKDSEIPPDMTSQIASHYTANKSKMESLSEKSKGDLELWIDLDQEKRKTISQ